MKAKRCFQRFLLFPLILSLVSVPVGCRPSPSSEPFPGRTPVPTSPTASFSPTPVNLEVPYAEVSGDNLLAYLNDLTSIQPYSGWRNSASQGEAEALDYIAAKLGEFSFLNETGMELERQSFPVYLSTDIREAGLTLTVQGQDIQVPAQGIRGNRFNRVNAVYFDSDGIINDSNPDPVTARGAPLIVLDEDTLYGLDAEQLEGRILFLDYSLIDVITSQGSSNGSVVGGVENTVTLLGLIERGLAGVVLVAHYSDKSGESHGTAISEGANFSRGVPTRRVPILYVRLEDLAPAGIAAWQDLQQVSAAQLLLDADVFSPGKSGNLIARLPGLDSSSAVILGAHIDSPNTPGALDDGSGCAALLEVARVLEDAHIRPPVDLYLAWFGSEELGIYGSAYFVSTHQELLDHTLAMVQMDAMGLPLDGRSPTLLAVLTPYDRFGQDPLLLPGFLSRTLAGQGINIEPSIEYGVASDNNNFEAFDVPNIDLIYVNAREFQYGERPIHYSSHWHDPYETVDRVSSSVNALVEMARVLLAAALEIGSQRPDLRVTPAPTHQALILASHTESFGVTTLRELGAALSWEGFDVDLLPYGRAVSLQDLEGVKIVILPPALNSPSRPQEVWGSEEMSLLQDYVAGGGLLVVVNSECEYVSTICFASPNLSARSVNPLLEPMGIRFLMGSAGSDNTTLAVAEHPLTKNAPYLTLQGENAFPFLMESGTVLYQAASLQPLVGLVDYGENGGQVLVIAELGLLRDSGGGSRNIEFIKNIARYALER